MAGRPAGFSSDQKIKAAWLYHVEGLTQEQVAELLGVSRIKVMRLLADCLAEGVVTVRINRAAAAQVALERRLEQRFGLRSAVVFPTSSSEEGLETALAFALAGVTEQVVRPGATVAVGSGATLFRSLRHIEGRPLAEGAIVGMVGGLPHSGWINPSAMAVRLAEKFGLPSWQITAPVLVDSPEVAAALWRHAALREVRARAMAADAALLTVGAHWREGTVFRHGLIPPEHFDSLARAGAVANLLCRFIDAEGREVDHELNRRIMSLGLDEIAAIPEIVLAAAGASRAGAIRAAMRAVPVTTFITDEAAALALLEGSRTA